MIFLAIKKMYIRYQTRRLTLSLLAHIDLLSDELHWAGKNSDEYEGQLLRCLHVYREILNLNNDPKISALIHKVGHDVRHSYVRHCGMEVMRC